MDWWFRPEGVWNESEQYYEFGMTNAEQQTFILADVTTYPGFYDLNTDAQACASVLRS